MYTRHSRNKKYWKQKLGIPLHKSVVFVFFSPSNLRLLFEFELYWMCSCVCAFVCVPLEHWKLHFGRTHIKKSAPQAKINNISNARRRKRCERIQHRLECLKKLNYFFMFRQLLRSNCTIKIHSSELWKKTTITTKMRSHLMRKAPECLNIVAKIYHHYDRYQLLCNFMIKTTVWIIICFHWKRTDSADRNEANRIDWNIYWMQPISSQIISEEMVFMQPSMQ